MYPQRNKIKPTKIGEETLKWNEYITETNEHNYIPDEKRNYVELTQVTFELNILTIYPEFKGTKGA